MPEGYMIPSIVFEKAYSSEIIERMKWVPGGLRSFGSADIVVVVDESAIDGD